MSLLRALQEYDKKTLFLYIAIIIFATIFACLSQSKIKKATINGNELYVRDFNKLPYFLSFFTLAFFVATTANGTDRVVYGNMFLEISWGTILNGQEPGFNVLMLFIKLFTKNPAVFCGILSVLTFTLAYKGFYDLKDDINIGLTVFIYSSVYYLQSYNLMRMYFALAVIISGVKFLKQKNYFKYFVVLVVATLIHYSVIFVVFAYILALIYINLKHWSLGIHALWTILGMVALFFIIRASVDVIKDIDNPIIQRYYQYLINIKNSSLGIMWIVNSLPAIIAIYFAKEFKDEINFRRIAMAFMFTNMLINIFAYSIPVIGRASTVLSFCNIIYYPYILEKYAKQKTIEKQICIIENKYTARYSYFNNSKNYLLWFVVAFFVAQTILYLCQYRLSDGIDDYKFIWENYLW